jgi:hypothetical protein
MRTSQAKPFLQSVFSIHGFPHPTVPAWLSLISEMRSAIENMCFKNNEKDKTLFALLNFVLFCNLTKFILRFDFQVVFFFE